MEKKYYFDARARVDGNQILAHLPYLRYSDKIRDSRGVYRELLYPDCFTFDDNVEIFLDHSGPALGSIREGNLKVRSDLEGLWVRYTPRPQDMHIYRKVENKELDGLSPGFKVDRDTFGEFHGEMVRQVYRAKLIEVSLTAQPAYFGASSCIQERSKQKPGTESRIISFGDGIYGIIEDDRVNWKLGVLR